MSDSIDRVFVKAITTIKALSSRSNYGSLPRPPAENRIKLYGLYKQATEGNVEGIMSRPVGYSMEDEGAKKKWDAWKREEGLSKTEAKRRYISFLIDTMKVYASGTLEARELLSELEYLWDQIKDLQFTSDEENEHEHQGANPYQLSYPQSLSFSHPGDQSDRLSNATPLPGASNYSASIAPNQQSYRNNLQRIYSHSRRSTMLSINDYINQQRQTQGNNAEQNKDADASIYSFPPPPLNAPKLNDSFVRSLPGPNNNVGDAGVPGDATTLEEFRKWQGEINGIINRLSKDFFYEKSLRRSGSIGALKASRSGNSGSSTNHPLARGDRYRSSSSESDSSDYSDLDPSIRLRKRIIHILKVLGVNALKFLKNFSVSVLAILFIVWCFKKNVVVQRTLVKQPVSSNNKQKKELVINMVLNTDENKWFIRLLNILNSFVGFV